MKAMERFSSRSHRIGPKVHKNRRIYDKWGMQYHKAVQDVVFGTQCLPYMPTEPPASLSEEIVESGPLYVCKHCKDCFRFQSSFEDHNARRTWILGVWCYNCFETVCTHIPESQSTGSADIKCPTCVKKSSDKRAYLRTKGLHKSQRMGVTRVFYNQCQFVEHLKMHRLSSVNIADLMLMPLPVKVSNSDWSTALEVVCEALMEWAFLSRIHVVEWLKLHNLQNNWWELTKVNGQSNYAIDKIVKNYQGRELFKICNTSTADMINFSSSNVVHSSNKSSPDIEFIDDSMDQNTNSSADIISDKNILENEDNPCIPNDITFVDCGPASQCLEPELPVNCIPKMPLTAQEMKYCRLANTVRTNNKTNEAFKDCNSLETDTIRENAITAKAADNGSNTNLIIKPSFRDYVRKKPAQLHVKKTAENNLSKLITKTGVSKISNTPVKIGIPLPAKKSTITKTNSENLQTSILNSNSKVLKFQGNIQDSKNIASIISQLPSHFISPKNVVFIEQDSSNVIAHNKNEVTTTKDLVVNNNGTDFNISTQKMYDTNIKKQEITGRIIIRNGKKYIIKRAKNITQDPKSSFNLSIVNNVTKNATKQLTSEHNTSRLTSANSNEVENISVEQMTLLHNNISLLTPSPSSSESSSSGTCDLKKNSIMPTLQKVPSHLISISAMPTQRPEVISETITLIREENGDLYMDIKVVDRIARESFREICDIIVKYRKEMFDEFSKMNSLELKERLDHLQCVIEEMRQVLNFMSEDVFREKLRAVNTLQCMLEECLKKYNQDVILDKRIDDVMLNAWETRMDQVQKCLKCNKLMKPKSYIAGFSVLPKNDNAYCSCYKQVCQECLSHQGNISRFNAHQNFHKKRKPYNCPDCNAKFNSFTSLEIHTWTVCFHILKKYVFTCKICEIDGFKDLESITRHFVVMHSKTKVGCENCSRVFSSYGEYVQHCTEMHSSKMEQNPVRLVICKLSNVILRSENYMSYLDKYPGIRKLVWFKCPFCTLKTTDNKHVTTLLHNHIRKVHVESLAKVLTKEAFEIYGTTFLKVEKSAIQQFLKRVISENTIANKTSCTDGTLMPKIVNTRTISSETFERGSQDTESWSTNTNQVIDESPQTMKKIDTEKSQLPPKINVRSIDDLKSSKSKAVTKFFSTETMKSNSSSLQVTNEDGKVDLFVHEEMKIELDNSKEETAKTEKPNKDNNKLTMSTLCDSEFGKPLLIDTVDVNSLIASNQNYTNCIEIRKSKSYDFDEVERLKVLNSISEASADNRIKIVDFKTICRSVIEPLAEMDDIQMKNDNVDMTSVPKPPPLAKIPQHLLEPVETSQPENNSEKSKLKNSCTGRIVGKSKVLIALGTDAQKEGYVDYLCHLCNERINTSQLVAQTHFREKHSDEYRVAVITPQLSRMSPDFINGGYKQLINNKKRKSDSAFATKRKRRWTPKRSVEVKDTNPPAGLCVEQETAEDGEGNFICKKCGQRCADMPDLREHIAANHRLKGRYLICLECGENFVVAPSLQMHLKAFHGIEDPINYMNQNPAYASDSNGDLQTGGRTVANQCYVCMAVFEDKAAVDKHLRVHGMAFLNRKRIEARNALEKKNNTEEDKSSIIKNGSKEAAKQDKPVETILEKINAAI